MDQRIYREYISILNEELVPALGCTEPIAIALAAAKAREVLGSMPEHISVECSGNVIKNAMGVTVPGTGNMKGVHTAAVLGAVGGIPAKNLEVLSEIGPEDVEKTAELLGGNICSVHILETEYPLHIIVRAEAEGRSAMTEIRGHHTNFVRIEKDNRLIFESPSQSPAADYATDRSLLNLEDILLFAEEADTEDLERIFGRQITLNTDIAREGLEHDYGCRVGATLLKNSGTDDVRTYARALAAAGSDARMGGCVMPVIITSGSGNQGLTVSLPVIAYAEHLGASREKMLRALGISNLVALLHKREIGRLSAYCGAVCSACGSGAAITWLHGGGLEMISGTITNMLGNVSGIICDGAKSSCAAKIASSVDAAILAHEMAMDGNSFAPGEGIVKPGAEKTMASTGRLARKGMAETDREILRIMIES
ncbi:L-serine ammonia-lyase, iron-sulfur-dependent, subunit alpha [Treponema sp. OttesenSCG-928-L16]|nr:L-serine ammonia-lyase, iron-sulfur-dependent, subunit alpha [Treponema sp. OttesenSCG-928-L16]